MRPHIEVIYGSAMQPGDLYCAKVEIGSKYRPVHDFAAPHEVVSVTRYTDDTGRAMLRVEATHGLELSPLPIGTQVIVIRGAS